MSRFNERLAVAITSVVATMWCAYIFAALALVSLPDAIKGGRPTIVAWIAQTFLQLVLLSIIMVGQKVTATKVDETTQAVDAHRKVTERHHASLQSLHAKLDELKPKPRRRTTT